MYISIIETERVESDGLYGCYASHDYFLNYIMDENEYFFGIGLPVNRIFVLIYHGYKNWLSIHSYNYHIFTEVDWSYGCYASLVKPITTKIFFYHCEPR